MKIFAKTIVTFGMSLLTSCGGNVTDNSITYKDDTPDLSDDRLLKNGSLEIAEHSVVRVENLAWNASFSGTLIGTDIILTCKHCVYGIPTEHLRAWVQPLSAQGDVNSLSRPSRPESMAVVGKTMHPCADLALLKLADTAGVPSSVVNHQDISSYVFTDPLWVHLSLESPLYQIIQWGHEVKLVGFGTTTVGTPSDNRKRSGYSNILEVDRHRNATSIDAPDCPAGENVQLIRIGNFPLTTPRTGDSGGPAFREVSGEKRLVGIMVTGKYLVDVSYFYCWIREQSLRLSPDILWPGPQCRRQDLAAPHA